MKEFWDERYQQKEYVYGVHPNQFLAEQLIKIPHAGDILFPCEGEGRNAVFAATSGWRVDAFDYSESGKTKALQLAQNHNVSISYFISDAIHFDFGNAKYDVVAFIFAHFGPDLRSEIHQKAISSLKPGGRIIIEAFNPWQLNNKSGGPKDLSMLYTEEILNEDFKKLDIQILETKVIELDEGLYHRGKADVIRLLAIKK
ncbi:MAG: class I SAM-dependent methyltransferase [Saprospiraceae bacterium]|nr:class I SAM-dependent methyltransferase [Saprospiraceae bacterium]MBP6567602.1 class I SAM-dependent methyltransferase [Saprospiraceae bacterium]